MEESRLSQFSGLISSAAKSIQRLKHAKMKQLRLSSAQAAFLCRLAEAGEEGLTQGELITLEGMDRAQVSRVLKNLCARQYTAPAQPGSGYKRHYVLTPKGEEAARELRGAMREIDQLVHGHIPERDAEVFCRILSGIRHGLEQAEGKLPT